VSLWRQLTRGLNVLAHRKAADQDVTDEVDHYLEQATAELMASGLSREDARRTARLELGSPAVVRDQVRSSGWENVLGTLLTDLRFAMRQLVRNPGFAIVSTVTLALGIGASTAIFSAVNPILFKPLPYPHASQLMMIWEMRSDSSPQPVTFGTFYGLAQRSHSFAAMAVMKPWQPTMIGNDYPERFDGQRVSADYFRALDVAPGLGRDFQASDDQFNGPNVVIISDRLWRRHFAGDRAIIGRQLKLDDNLFTVIGVMPVSFENVLDSSAELWVPLQYDPTLPTDSRDWGHHLRMVGRLSPGTSRDQARNELTVALHTLAQIYAKGYDTSGGAPAGMVVNRLQDDLTADVRPALLAILGAVVLVLLIVCVNMTNLLLAHGARRHSEFTMRAALGAGRMRMIRQLLAESLLLAGIGATLGMAVAEVGVRALVALSPPGLPRVGAIRIDGAVFAFGLAITTVVGLVVGLIPAIHASRSNSQNSPLQSSRTTTEGHQWTRRVLVIAEVALAFVLLVNAGLLLHSLNRLFAVAPGFDASHLLTMQVQESGHKFDTDSARAIFFTQALEAVRQLPGVTACAFTSQLPLSGDFEIYGVEFEAHPKDNAPGIRYAVSADYFATMGIPLHRGRLLDERDQAGAPGAVVVSESFAKHNFGGQDPIGQRVRLGPDEGHSDRPWSTVVGIVGDVKQASLAVSDAGDFYTSTTQWPWVAEAQSLVVRTRGNPAALSSAVKKAIWSVDKDQPIVRVATMEDLLAESEAQRHFALVVFEAFGFAALVLAAVGVYGVLSGSVTERMRELGVRAALGASRGTILALVMRQGMTLTTIGAAIGLGAAVAASQAIVSMLYGISQFDALTYAGVMALLASVSGIACWVPAWRAARVDPSIALRNE
jgi:putative ABC transport system permease protein